MTASGVSSGGGSAIEPYAAAPPSARMHLHAVVLGRALSRVLAGLEAARGARAPPALA